MFYLAIDIGASSGRHILGSIKDGKLFLEEIHRFDNGFKNENGVLVWFRINIKMIDTREMIYYVTDIGTTTVEVPQYQ